MKVGIVGAGRVGCSLALALAGRGIDVAGVCSNSPESVDFIGRKLGRNFENDAAEVLENSDTVFLTVPDTVIEAAAFALSSSGGREKTAGKVFLHMSGALVSDVLDPLREAGGLTGSLHPIQTFPDRESSWTGMYGIYFGFEGMAGARVKAAETVKALDGGILDIKAEAKPLYHAAACVISNYVTVLSHIAGSLLEGAGIERSQGIRAFGPLLLKSAENIVSHGSAGALTGPISRGDAGTVAGHLKALEHVDRELLAIYRSLGIATVGLALEKGSIGREKADALLGLLKQGMD